MKLMRYRSFQLLSISLLACTIALIHLARSDISDHNSFSNKELPRIEQNGPETEQIERFSRRLLETQIQQKLSSVERITKLPLFMMKPKSIDSGEAHKKSPSLDKLVNFKKPAQSHEFAEETEHIALEKKPTNDVLQKTPLDTPAAPKSPGPPKPIAIKDVGEVAKPHQEPPDPSAPGHRTKVHGRVPGTMCNCYPIHHDPATRFAAEDLEMEDPAYGTTTLRSLEKHHPNLAIHYVAKNISHCNLMPDLTEIAWQNVHWQQHRVTEIEELMLFSAFYDNRTLTVPSGGAVRLVSLLKGAPLLDDSKLPWCHLWYKDQIEPIVSRVVRVDYVDHQVPSTEHLQTFLLTCAAPDRKVRTIYGIKMLDDTIPYAVSIVTSPCDKSTNLLKVNGKPKRRLSRYVFDQNPNYNDPSHPTWRVGVCGTAIFYLQYDFSLRMVEWLETTRAQGVSQVFLYHTGRVHPNVDKVLKYYEKTGYVTLTDFHYPSSYVDEPLLRRIWTKTLRKHIFALENIYFTDCMLRNMDNYRFIVHVDPDELIVMEKQDEQSLPELMAYLTNKTKGFTDPIYSYSLRWRFFPAEDSLPLNSLPKHFHIMRHAYRLVDDKEPKHHNVKTIYDARSATGVTSHTLRVCADGPCLSQFKVSMNLATIGHFREDCSKICGGETEYVPQVHRYRNQVVDAVNDALTELGMMPDYGKK